MTTSSAQALTCNGSGEGLSGLSPRFSMETVFYILGAITLMLLNVLLLLCIKTLRLRIHRQLEEEKAELSYNIPPSLLGAGHG